MFAKLYFDTNWTAQTDLMPVILSVLTGSTDVNAIPGATSKFMPGLSYILTNKSSSGWSYEGSGTATQRVISAPCKDSTKKKYVRFISPISTRIALELGEGTNGSGVLTGQASFDDPNQMANNLIYSGGSNTFPHWTGAPLEVWVSASARHFLVACNQPGYMHGVGGNGSRSGGWVVGAVEHTAADSWITESSSYIPACLMTSATNASASGTGTLTFYRNRSRNIASPTPVDFANNVPGSFLEAYTKYGSDTISNITLAGTNQVLLDESNAVKTLLPFGARSKVGLVRGGSITDVCDIYLAPANIFKENLQIQVGENAANRYHVWNLGFSGNTTAGYNLVVPRG